MAEGQFLEHAEVFGNYYGTSRDWVRQQMAQDREAHEQRTREAKEEKDRAAKEEEAQSERNLRGIFTAEELDELLAPHELTEPGVAGGFRFTPKLPEGTKPPTGPVGAGG